MWRAIDVIRFEIRIDWCRCIQYNKLVQEAYKCWIRKWFIFIALLLSASTFIKFIDVSAQRLTYKNPEPIVIIILIMCDWKIELQCLFAFLFVPFSLFAVFSWKCIRIRCNWFCQQSSMIQRSLTRAARCLWCFNTLISKVQASQFVTREINNGMLNVRVTS